jgi:hypothetical protein
MRWTTLEKGPGDEVDHIREGAGDKVSTLEKGSGDEVDNSGRMGWEIRATELIMVSLLHILYF